MFCYLIRHGKDDETLRGGWSDTPLTKEGAVQAEVLAARLAGDGEQNIARIYASDLPRARQTAQILSQKTRIPIEYLPGFREVNNGVLAGMKNEDALAQYPGLFWNALEWEEAYPGGESPREFYERISAAWRVFTADVMAQNQNVILVTHGGVINVILHIVKGLDYSNRNKPFPVKHTEVIAIEL